MILCYCYQTAAFLLTPRVIKTFRPSNSIRSSSSTTILQATWSNGQAVREYQDFLASGRQEIPKEADGPSVIVVSSKDDKNNPSSPLARALFSLNPQQNDVIVTPQDPLPVAMGTNRESYPIYIAVPPQELKDFITQLSDSWKEKREDFIFLSGGPFAGVIEPVLKDYGYARDSMTQLLCGGFTLPVTGKPQDLSCKIGVDSQGEDKWTGETAVCGKWAGAVQERFENNGIRCKTGFYREWRRWMWERASLDAVFHLVGAVREEPTTMKDVALYYEQEASDMLWQVTSNLRGWLAVTLSYGFEERLFGFAEAQCGDVLCEISEEMFPFVYGPPLDKCGMIIEYLNYAKDERGLIPNIQLPKCDSIKPSLVMKQGNLRAEDRKSVV